MIRQQKKKMIMGVVLAVFAGLQPWAVSKELNWSIGVPKFFGLEYSQEMAQAGSLKNFRLGASAGILPLTGAVKTLFGGITTSWSDEYNMWVEPRFGSYSWSVFVDWMSDSKDWGIRADWVVSRFKGGGLAHLQNKETKVVAPVYDIQAAATFVYPSLGFLKYWGNPESRWRLGFLVGYRVKTYTSIQSSGPLAQLSSLEAGYTDAFQEGVDKAENELASDLQNTQKISHWIPTIEFAKSF